MRQLSRFMPPYVAPSRRSWQYVSCILFFGSLIVLITNVIYHRSLNVFLVVAGFSLLSLIFGKSRINRLQKLANERPGQSICEFSRSFDLREIDPWIVRAVYEQFQAYLEPECARFPLHSTDRFAVELGIDEDDWSIDLVNEIAQRTGRDINSPQARSYQLRVETIGDLVTYFNQLPKIRAT